MITQEVIKAATTIMSDGRPRHEGEIRDALTRRGFGVDEVEIGGLMVCIPGILGDGEVEAPSGPRRTLKCWRLGDGR